MNSTRKHATYPAPVIVDAKCLYFFKKYPMIQAGRFTESTYFGEFLVLENTNYCHYLLP